MRVVSKPWTVQLEVGTDVNGDAQDGSTGGPEVGPPPGAMEDVTGAMAEAALDAPPPGEMPPGGMPLDQIEAPDEAEEPADEGDS